MAAASCGELRAKRLMQAQQQGGWAQGRAARRGGCVLKQLLRKASLERLAKLWPRPTDEASLLRERSMTCTQIMIAL